MLGFQRELLFRSNPTTGSCWGLQTTDDDTVSWRVEPLRTKHVREDDPCFSAAELCIIVWPIRADGSISEVFLNSLRILRSGKNVPPSLKYCGFLTDRLAAHGVLVSSSKLSQLTRMQPSSFCGADLSPIRMYNLLEYRDVDTSTFEHHVCSNEFRFLHLGQEDTELLSKNIEVRCTSAGLIEGVLYWWQLGNYSTRQDRGAFFLFKEPISVNAGTLLNLTCDVYCGSILLSAELV
ncbi:hypothetical protein Y032_0039g38 [Ancylostoma ceylanicum]|uniref:Uncharacterized protein n=1 Tax=Ancylostoma ceylanicum TaxID=53326 RepID=A0A016UJ18_9BILA|nr:hypothetical protein Y032_0039g38 [Ancylostoma ceylanicum]